MSDKPTWTPIRIRLGQLQPWERNPKFSTKEDARRLVESEKKWGQPQTFSVSPSYENGKVDCYDGHQRLNAWQSVYSLDMEIWAMQADRHLTEKEREEFVLQTHNAHGQWSWDTLSGWDAETLKEGWFNSDTLHGWNMDALNLREMLNSDAEPVDPNEEWEGMPEFEQEDKTAVKSIHVSFASIGDYETFAELIGQKLTEKTRSIWYPEQKPDSQKAYRVEDES